MNGCIDMKMTMLKTQYTFNLEEYRDRLDLWIRFLILLMYLKRDEMN